MAAQHEIYNFLSKFLHLHSTGKSAQLVLECQNGQVRVHLHHVLGPNPHHDQPQCREQHHRQGPSRLRRRTRRAESRATTAAATGPVNDEFKADHNEVLKNIDCDVVAPAEKKVVEKACQVSAAVLTHHQDQAVQVVPPAHKLCHEVAVQTPPEVHTVPGGQIQAHLVLPHQQHAAKTKSWVKNFSIQKVQSTSIPPRGIYHPAMINACIAITGKHPSQLNAEEATKFNTYREYKIQQGDPIEESIMYLPSSMKNCLQCGELT